MSDNTQTDAHPDSGKETRVDIANLRALAIILVVLGHSIIIYSPSWGLYTPGIASPFFSHLKDVINMLQMPLFMSLSGYSLGFTLRHYPKGTRFLVKKAKRLLVPFLVFGFFWMVPVRLAVGYAGYQGVSLRHVLFADVILGADNGHLWFLPTLFLIFCLVAALIKLFGTDRLIVPLCVASLIAISLQGNPLPAYIANVATYLPYFTLGNLIFRATEVISAARDSRVFRLLSIIIFAACCAVTWFNPLSGIKGTLISVVSVSSLYVLSPNRSNSGMNRISKDSMGIYLFHSPCVYLSYSMCPDIEPMLMLVLNFFGFGSICLLAVEAVRASGLKAIIGE